MPNPPTSQPAALLWSGGKDSALALYHARKAHPDINIVTLVTCITVLVAGSMDPSNSNAASPVVTSSAHVTPLASGQLEGLQTEIAQRLASSKQ